jgi:predicted RNA-binding Zn ribbon-like protein
VVYISVPAVGKIMSLNITINRFKFIGGNTSLDFVNTVNGRISNPNKNSGHDYYDAFPSDKIKNYADLIGWSLQAGLINDREAKKLVELAADDSDPAGAVLERALNLRESIYRLYRSVVERWQPETEDLEKLNRELSIARRHQRLSTSKNGFVFEWIDRQGAFDLMLWQISEAAAEMFISGDLGRIHYCRNNVCNWLFLDTSRNGRRQWCDMKDCGNLAKVRRFRAKQPTK